MGPCGWGKDRKAEMLCFSAACAPLGGFMGRGGEDGFRSDPKYRIGPRYKIFFIVSDHTEVERKERWLCAKHSNVIMVATGGLSSHAI